MAIKLPDPGNGIPEQKTGNDEWTNMNIVRDNFADKSNAASRLVGKASGNLVEMKGGSVGGGGYLAVNPPTITSTEVDSETLATGFYSIRENSNTPLASYVSLLNIGYSAINHKAQLIFSFNRTAPVIRVRTMQGTWSPVATLYHNLNTTVDVNKNIKQSSPVLQVFKDGVKKVHEANELPIKFTRNGVGDYTIEGTTGLRENDWQIVIPEDDHKNQLIAFTIEDDNGTIHLKTYKRTFSMETFTFRPDLKTPMEIPEGLWVDLHFNDLPKEQLDEPAI